MCEKFNRDRSKKLCILLTATIDPKGVVFLTRSNPCVREKDYIDSLIRWMRLPLPVVFCENSGYELSKIKNIVEESTKKDIEILQYNGQDFPRELGKGYGELNTIQYAIKHSLLIKDSTYVIKVNGRYFIKNIEKIANCLLSSEDTYVMADLQKNFTWADSRVFGFKPSFIDKYLSKLQELLNDSKGIHLEHIMIRAVLSAISDGHNWLPLPVKPIIIGYYGTSDIRYKESRIIGRIIHRVKNYINKIY